MSPRVRRLIAAAIVIALVAGIWALIPSEEERILKVIEKARNAVSSENRPGGNLDLIARVAELTSCLTRDIEVRADVFGGISGSLSGIDEVRATAAGIPQQIPGLRVALGEVAVTVEDTAHARVSLVATIQADGRRSPAAQEFSLAMRKFEGHWYISRIETVRALRPE
jgi:hypothetical protein